MSQIDHPVHQCTTCVKCLDYVAWLEGELLRVVEFYHGLVDVMASHASVTEHATRLAALFGESRDVVQRRRLHQIERHLSEGNGQQP